MRIGVIGTGNMGGALIAAFRNNRYDVVAYNRGREKLFAVCGQTGATAALSAEKLTQVCDVIVLAVKPNSMGELLYEIRGCLDEKKLLISVAVGLPIKFYTDIIGESRKVIRTMPNTPASVGEGMTVVCFGDMLSEEDKSLVMELLACAGRVQELPERLIGEVTALTGSSPAYVCMMIEAMADGAVLSGIPRAMALEMAAQAVLGTAKLMLESGEHPAVLKDAVCSPAGTTIAAVAELERKGFRSAIIDAMIACNDAAGRIASG